MNILLIDFVDTPNAEKFINDGRVTSVLSISPMHDDADNVDNSYAQYRKNYTNTNLGLEYIRLYCEKHCKLDSIVILSHEDALQTTLTPDVVGISFVKALGQSEDFIREYVEAIRQKFSSNPLLVAGGQLAMTHRTKLVSYFDAICIGEGEIPFAELINSTNKIQHLKDSPHWYTLLNIEKRIKHYILDDLRIIPRFDKKYLDRFYFQNGQKCLPLMLSRGCTYTCMYCAVHATRPFKCHKLPMKNIIDDLTYYIQLGFNSFYIQDDRALSDKELCIVLFKFLYINNCKVSFEAFDWQVLDDELISLLVKVYNFDEQTNTVEASINPNAATETTMHKMGKQTQTFKQLKDVISKLKKHNFTLTGHVLIGHPFDTLNDIKLSRIEDYFYNEMKYDKIYIFETIVQNDTTLHKLAVKQNLIKEDEYYFKQEPVFLKHLIDTPEKMEYVCS